MIAAKAPAWPAELRFRKAEAALHVKFDDGFEGAIPYELLRVESPSAETKGHSAADRPPPPAGKRKVSVTGAEPVGRYAVRIRFDDGHDTGLYTWSYLRELAEQKAARMTTYLAQMKKLGLSRD
ncbi:MAG TPA: gamma-butyrobetaine hydroxylase-like domain-containing protein [Hyphomonadaceae bacterium]|nr:gamma-butyrobetaine hydroxylase-like domain-containing protein [Hyphomonadaceae bacterium]